MNKPLPCVYLVGLGPAQAGYVLPEAEQALELSHHWVGYGYYLELAAQLLPRCQAQRHAFALGQELARCEYAIELAWGGETTALVCSGDGGIYAMGSPLLQCLEQRGDWQRQITLKRVPGISAAQMLANEVGAPLGHDFCTISLSDLLTPWAKIEKRVALASEADFVIAIYNPASAKRDRLERVRDLLLRWRGGDTPVCYGQKLGRPDKRVWLGRLADMSGREVNMHTVLIVGSSQTRCLSDSLVYTPRDYHV